MASNIRIDDDSSLDSATISDNTISQAGQNSVQIDNNGDNPICTTISGNLSSNPNFAGLGGNDFNLELQKATHSKWLIYLISVPTITMLSLASMALWFLLAPRLLLLRMWLVVLRMRSCFVKQ